MSLILPFLKYIPQVHLCWIAQGLCSVPASSGIVSSPWGHHVSWLKRGYEINKHITDREGTAIQLIRPPQYGNKKYVEMLSESPDTNSSVTWERERERDTRQLGSLLEWAVHYLFMFCSALSMMKFIIYGRSTFFEFFQFASLTLFIYF